MQVKRWGCATLAALCLTTTAALAEPLSCQHGWGVYQQRFITADGRVTDTGNQGISHSEGQGYAMLMAEASGDRRTFNRLWQWTKKTLQREDRLFSWRYDPQAKPAVTDRNNASDGDLLIAWALLRAGERWHESAYTNASKSIRKAIQVHLVQREPGYTILLPGLEGFKRPDGTVINLSYWIFPALQAFTRVDPKGPWTELFESGKRLIQTARFGEAKLPSDWIVMDAAGTLRPAQGWPSRFGFDAVRVPLYGAWAGMGREDEWGAVSTFWHSKDPASPPAWIDLMSGEVAPYAASWGVLSIRALVDGQLQPLQREVLEQEDYYSSSLLMLSQIAQGNCSSAK
ncbi:glycosyl hydrolase family 8 [Pseudomonas asuensis]|nr:glycosyl hydrolase family 8 [Pseudomonas asuensis]